MATAGTALDVGQTQRFQPADIENVVPPEMTITQPQSAAKAILNDRWFQIPSQANQTFTHFLNDTIDFRFGSSLEFVWFPMSYITFDFELTGFEFILPNELPKFDIGGVHSIFTSIRLRTVNGEVDLEERRDYNRDYVRRLITNGDVNDIEAGGWHMGEGPLGIHQNHTQHHIHERRYAKLISVVDGTSEFFSTDRPMWDIVKGDFFLLGAVSQEITEVFPNGQTFKHVANVALAALGPVGKTILFTRGMGADHDGDYERRGIRSNSLPMTSFVGLKNSDPIRDSPKPSAGDLQRKHKMYFQPDLELWKIMFPLLFVQGGLRLELQLEHPSRCMYFPGDQQDAGQARANFDYKISNPVLHLRYVTPHPQIRNVIRRQFDTRNGLELTIRGTRIRTNTRTGGQTADTIEIFPGLRSVRGCQVVLQDTVISEGTGLIPELNPSLSSFLSTGITEVFMSIGSLRFPDVPIDTDGFGRELFKHLLFYRDRMAPEMDTNLSAVTYADWTKAHSYIVKGTPADDTDGIASDARFFIMSFDFSRAAEPFGYLTGLDAHSLPLLLNVKRENLTLTRSNHVGAGFQGNVRYRFFLDYDKLIAMSSQSGISTSE